MKEWIVNEHWSKAPGGTALTNFSEEHRSIYEEAVRRFGDPDFVVYEKPTPAMQRRPGGSLHWRKAGGVGQDAGPFWRVFEKVQEEFRSAQRP